MLVLIALINLHDMFRSARIVIRDAFKVDQRY
jgi:hypothetical protein